MGNGESRPARRLPPLRPSAAATCRARRLPAACEAWGGVESQRLRRPHRLTEHTARATTCGCVRKRHRSKEPPALAAP